MAKTKVHFGFEYDKPDDRFNKLSFTPYGD